MCHYSLFMFYSRSLGIDTCWKNTSERGRALRKRSGTSCPPPLRSESVPQSHISRNIKLRGPSCGRQGWLQGLGETAACILKSFVFPHHLCKELDMTQSRAQGSSLHHSKQRHSMRLARPFPVRMSVCHTLPSAYLLKPPEPPHCKG